MSFTRIKMSEAQSSRARSLSGRLGLRPNIIYRFGLCLSLEDPSIPNPSLYDEKGQELTRETLLGEWDLFFVALVKERLVNDGFNPITDLDLQLKAHINRGTDLFCNKIRTLADVYDLIPKELLTQSPRQIGESSPEKRTGDS